MEIDFNSQISFSYCRQVILFLEIMVSLLLFMRINLKHLVGSSNFIIFWYDVWFGEVSFTSFFLIYLLRPKHRANHIDTSLK
jgi:hypothetical protein